MPPAVTRTAKLFTGAMALAAILGGCAAGAPSPVDLTVDLPKSYLNESKALALVSQSGLNTPLRYWWQGYGSSELNKLVERALERNPDLKIANSQVRQAKIRASQANAGALPTVSVPARAAVGSGSGGEALQNSQSGLQANYRLDLWGERSYQIVSADQIVWRAVYERDNLMRTLIGSVVTTYIAYLVTCDQIVTSEENEKTAVDLQRTVEHRMALGEATIDELERQRDALYQQQAVHSGLVNQKADLQNALSRLLGVLPSELIVTGGTVEQLTTPNVSAGIPATLLVNRPDIRAVEARMLSANANIEVARARLLPPVDLAIQGGYNGLGIAQLFQPQNFFLNGVASLAATIFDGGRLAADKDLAQAAYEDLVITYGQTVFQAVREVESALGGWRAAQERLNSQSLSHRSALNLFKSSSDAFALGAMDLAGQLSARRAYHRNLEDLRRTRGELLRAYAAVFQALGGGWADNS
jgi:NodT family efflux transporter outer membrane factor (OMF) lipoprotein